MPVIMNPQIEFDISVVIVTFNNKAIIGRCLSSLSHALSLYSSQVVIIDNDSRDGTALILQNEENWRSLYFNDIVRIYNRRNTCYTHAVNQGLVHCRGRFVLLLNPDIVFTGDPFLHLLPLFENPEIAVAAPQLRFPNGKVQPSCRRFPHKRDIFFEFLGLSRLFANSAFFSRWRMPDFNHDFSREVDQPQGAFLLVRRSVLENIGILDGRFPMFFSDVDWCYRIQKMGGKIWFCAETFVHHVRGASVRRRRAAMILSSHRSFVDYFQKYDATLWQKLGTCCVHILLLAAMPVRLLLLKIR
jgi:GT2 family glycosyltransferase